MISSYAQKSSTVQKAADAKAASVLDSSSQSESLQRKADMANNATQRAETPRPNNTGMPDNLKAGIESLSGFSMDDVRVHYNSSKPATVQALAYTQGTDIHVAPGQEKYLPHEAWHVAQQMAGRVSPTTNINGMPVNDNATLEHEADVMGERAVGQRNENLDEIIEGSTYCNALQEKISLCKIAPNIMQKVAIKVDDAIYLQSIKSEEDRYEQDVSEDTSSIENKEAKEPIKSSQPPQEDIQTIDQETSVPPPPTKIPSPPKFLTKIRSSITSENSSPAESLKDQLLKRKQGLNKTDQVATKINPVEKLNRKFANILGKEYKSYLKDQEEVKKEDRTNFELTIKSALDQIKDEPYVKEILKSSPQNNWCDIIIHQGGECAFENGHRKNDCLSLVMDIKQCEHMFYGDDVKKYKELDEGKKEDFRKKMISSILLHELGHAYQFYLKQISLDDRCLDNIKELENYSLFKNALLHFSEFKSTLQLALKNYFKESNKNDGKSESEINEKVDDIIGRLGNKNEQTIKEIVDIMRKIGEGAQFPNEDGDNILMNEIPFNVKNEIGIRTQYKGLLFQGESDMLNLYKIIMEQKDDVEQKDDEEQKGDVEQKGEKTFPKNESFGDIWEKDKDKILDKLNSSKTARNIVVEKFNESPAFLSQLYNDFWLNYLEIVAEKGLSADHIKVILNGKFDAKYKAILGITD